MKKRELFSPPLALILHTRALKVESIDAESKERQKVCVKEERARKLCRGQIMVFLDSKQMSLDFFLQKLGNNWRIIGRKCGCGILPSQDLLCLAGTVTASRHPRVPLLCFLDMSLCGTEVLLEPYGFVVHAFIRLKCVYFVNSFIPQRWRFWDEKANAYHQGLVGSQTCMKIILSQQVKWDSWYMHMQLRWLVYSGKEAYRRWEPGPT